MDLLLDQDVYALTANFLKDNGHDVVTASEIGHASSSDTTLLKIAQKKHRIFITRQRLWWTCFYQENKNRSYFIADFPINN